MAKIETLSLKVNRNDGFVGLWKDDVWDVSVANRTVTLNAGAPVTVTEAQIQALVQAVASRAYQFHYTCCDDFWYVDGGGYSPQLTVSGGGVTHVFGVSDGTCASSTHSYKGDVMRCSDYASIFAMLEAIAPSGVASSCWDPDRW